MITLLLRPSWRVRRATLWPPESKCLGRPGIRRGRDGQGSRRTGPQTAVQGRIVCCTKATVTWCREVGPPQSRCSFHLWPHGSQSAFRGRRAWPHVDPFVLHLFAALAEKERALISTRTRQTLSAAKARGVTL